MTRIRITIDYPVNFAYYPDHVKSKRDAMQYDIDNNPGEELTLFAKATTYEVVDEGED